MHRKTHTPRYAAVALSVAAALLLACGDLGILDPTTSRSQLLAVDLQSSAPGVSPVTVQVQNDRQTTVALRHGDSQNTLFASLVIPAGSITFANGAAAGTTTEVRLVPLSGEYGVRIEPLDIEFSSTNRPTLEFSAAIYGDFSVGPASGAYSSADEFFQDLQLWKAVGGSTWQSVAGTQLLELSSAVRARVSEGGSYLMAAQLPN